MGFSHGSEVFHVYAKKIHDIPYLFGTNYVCDDNGDVYKLSPIRDYEGAGFDVLLEVEMRELKHEFYLRLLRVVEYQKIYR